MAIEPTGKKPEPGSWNDPRVKRATAIGRILGPAIIVVPAGLIMFLRTGLRASRLNEPGADRQMLVGLAIVVAIGVIITIAVYARRGFDQR